MHFLEVHLLVLGHHKFAGDVLLLRKEFEGFERLLGGFKQREVRFIQLEGGLFLFSEVK